MFSNDLSRLTQRFTVDPKVLPMVPVRFRDGSECKEGMALLRQMVLARAYPDVLPGDRLKLTAKIFDTPATLDRLCMVSGGHVRELLRLLNDCIKKERKLPLSGEVLETVIRSYCNQMNLAITDDEWDLLCQVQQQKWVSGDDGYRILLRSRFVYEYRDLHGSWFDVNPILAESINKMIHDLRTGNENRRRVRVGVPLRGSKLRAASRRKVLPLFLRTHRNKSLTGFLRKSDYSDDKP